MAAANTDYFTEVGNPGTATTLAAPGHTIAGTTFNVVSTSNWPTTTGAIFAVDTYTLQTVNGVPNVAVRTPGSYTEWEGVVASATSITNATLRYGTDQNYSAGSLTRVYIPVASSRENRLSQGMLIEHTQLGRHVMTSPQVLTGINDTNGNELLKVTATASAVNELTLANAATGSAPTITATGGDTNIDVKVSGKGTGRFLPDGIGLPLNATVATSETTATTTYTDLTTVSDTVTVTIGTKGMAIVLLTSDVQNNAANAQVKVGFATSGATTVAPTANPNINYQTYGAAATGTYSGAFLVTGLTAGSTTFKMKYLTNTGTATFANRRIGVIPL